MIARGLIKRLKIYPDTRIAIQNTHINQDGSESMEIRDLQHDDVLFMGGRWVIRSVRNVLEPPKE